MKRCLIIAALGLCVTGPAAAEVFKCKGPDGKFAYQDGPCAGATTGGAVELKVHEPTAAETRRAQSNAVSESYRLDRIERSHEADRRQADYERARAERAKERQKEQCARNVARADRMERRASSAYTETAREYYREQSRELRDKHFSDCR